ncbi:unnamed protein product [Choristocarpus tenellus]
MPVLVLPSPSAKPHIRPHTPLSLPLYWVIAILIDVGSSMVAARIVGLCRGYAQSLTVELGVCLEGRCEEELPERCIGLIRLINLNLEGAEPLDGEGGTGRGPCFNGESGGGAEDRD